MMFLTKIQAIQLTIVSVVQRITDTSAVWSPQELRNCVVLVYTVLLYAALLLRAIDHYVKNFPPVCTKSSQTRWLPFWTSPGNLRNAVYGYVIEDDERSRLTFDSSSNSTTFMDFHDWRPPCEASLSVLLLVCHQIRAEFSSLLQNEAEKRGESTMTVTRFRPPVSVRYHEGSNQYSPDPESCWVHIRPAPAGRWSQTWNGFITWLQSYVLQRGMSPRQRRSGGLEVVEGVRYDIALRPLPSRSPVVAR